MPSTLPPKSSIAICIASAPFLPSRSAYRLDMSVMKPILSLSGVCCAHAVEAAETARQAMPSIEASTLGRFFMDRLLWMKTGDWGKRWGGVAAGRVSNAEQFSEHGHFLREL